MHRSIALFVLTSALLWHGLSTAAQASESGSESEYYRYVKRALKEFKIGNWEEAAALFERAHAISPNARTLRGMGMACFESRKYVKAIAYLEAALEEEKKPLTRNQKKEAEKILASAREFVAYFSIETDPPDVQLELDGKPVELVEGKLIMDPRQHQVVVSAPGYEKTVRLVEAEAGKFQQLKLQLTPVQEDQPAPPPEPEAQPVVSESRASSDAPLEDESDSSASLLPWIVIGSGGALLISSVVTGALTASARGDIDDKCPDGICAQDDREDVEAIQSRGEALRTATNVLLAIGAATVAAGGVLLVLDLYESETTPVAASLNCMPGYCGGSTRVSF